jgi:hypothetical protein
MKNIRANFITGFLLLAFFVALLSCTTDNAPLRIENSLPQSELAYYNDSFDRMREDLWERAGYVYKDEQIQNFKLADMRFENGKLVIRTKTDSFSKGGLGSKYALRGNFDLQLDCRIDFLKDASGMDQLLNIMVVDKSKKIGKTNTVVINLSMGDRSHLGWLASVAIINGRGQRSPSIMMKNFDGTLRILRKDRYISTLYKKEGESAWS